MGDDITKSVTVVIFNHKNEVLLIKSSEKSGHPTGTYGLPGGRVKKGETNDIAAIRECQEESGLKPQKLISLPTVYEADLARKNEGIKHFICQSFYCPEYIGEMNSSNEGEALWVSLNKVFDLSLIINVDKMIKEALKYNQEGGN